MAKLPRGYTDMIASAVGLSAKLLASLLYGNDSTSGIPMIAASNVPGISLDLL